MPKMTVKEMALDILNDMDSDAVDSINDTSEALQVAQILKTTYYEIIDGVDYWPHLNTLVQLTGLADVTKPTFLLLPETLQHMRWFKYNKRKSTDTKDKYAEVKYKSPDDFVTYTNNRVSSDSTVDVTSDFSSTSLLLRNDHAPTYWTSFDDTYIVCDSYDSAVDSTLQTSKTQASGPRTPTFTISDTFTPDLPENVFSYYLSEAKSVCFNALKQSANPKEEQRSKRQRYRAVGNKRRDNQTGGFASYGRRR